MKRSQTVVLVLSGAIMAGCGKPRENAGSSGSWSTNDLVRAQSVTNDTYIERRGYYHAPYHAFFPYPYNYYNPLFGYYHGGRYTPAPEQAGVTASPPGRSYYAAEQNAKESSHTTRGGFTRSSSSSGSHSSSS
jgi:hypothetical protein